MKIVVNLKKYVPFHPNPRVNSWDYKEHHRQLRQGYRPHFLRFHYRLVLRQS